jgi:hypothetical protein
MKKKIEQKPVSEIVPAMMEAINATGNFLDFLSQIGDWKFRTKHLASSKLSTQELDKSIEDQIINMLQANREYYMMYHFIQRENLWARWEMFRAECQKELLRIAPEDEEGAEDA